MVKPQSNTYAVILAGGEGTRFYPLSTPERPKQFLKLIGDGTFIQQTYERISPLVKDEHLFVSTKELSINKLDILGIYAMLVGSVIQQSKRTSP